MKALLKKIPGWLWGAIIAESLFLIMFVALGGLNLREQDLAFVVTFLPIQFIFYLPLKVSLLIFDKHETIRMLLVGSVSYIALGIFFGGIKNIRTLFKKNREVKLNKVWLAATVYLVISLLFLGYSIIKGREFSDLLQRSNNPVTIEDCTVQKEDLYRNGCLARWARTTNNVSVCEIINPQSVTRGFCYSQFGACTKIDASNNEAMGNCLVVKNGCEAMPENSLERRQCYYDAAIEAKDSSQCSRTLITPIQSGRPEDALYEDCVKRVYQLRFGNKALQP
jgi:hypothetical protein